MIIIFRAIKTGFKRTIKWIKYRSEMTKQTKTNSLNYLIDPTFHELIENLSYRLKMTMIEHLFQSVIHQNLK